MDVRNGCWVSVKHLELPNLIMYMYECMTFVVLIILMMYLYIIISCKLYGCPSTRNCGDNTKPHTLFILFIYRIASCQKWISLLQLGHYEEEGSAQRTGYSIVATVRYRSKRSLKKNLQQDIMVLWSLVQDKIDIRYYVIAILPSISCLNFSN